MDEQQLKTTAPETAPDDNTDPKTTLVESLIRAFGETTFQEFARYRFAEEREWYEMALFYQRRQWLRWNDSSKRWTLIKQNPDKPKPMPVSNYFAKAINSNANNLRMPKPSAEPSDDDPRNQRACDFAEKAVPAIDRESGMDKLCPLLAKHVALWGMGVTKDVMDTTMSSGKVRIPNPTLKLRTKVACSDCGVTSAGEDQDWGGNAANNMTEDADQPTPPMQGAPPPGEQQTDQGNGFDPDATEQTKCPACGSSNAVKYPEVQLLPAGSMVYAKGKLQTYVPPIFEIYLPRDCAHPTLAKRIVHRYRQSLGTLRRKYGDKAKTIKAEAPYDVHQIYMEALRALVNYNYMHEQTLEATTVTETWSAWEELPKRLQDQLTEFWADDENKLEQAQNDGIYEIHAGGTMLDWGPNYLKGETPFSFFLWEQDPANVYPKGAGTDLVPLQRRLNRIDSLVELAMMCNAAGKWLWPVTQNYKPPSGSPNEVIPYDVIGEGKVKPEFVSPVPFSPVVTAVRQSILADFQQLGSQTAAQPPANVKSFRGLAYLGQKQDEAINTQRDLWEAGHKIRWNKVLRMAQMLWDEPRATRVAGFNGRFGMMQIKGDDLKGEFEMEVIPDSSRPKTFQEKQQMFGALAAGGMVDLTDPKTRDYIDHMAGMDDVNLANHLQYVKADRDLDSLRRGGMPMPSPFQDPSTIFKCIAGFTLTEEFEALPVQIKQNIVEYAGKAKQMMDQAALANQEAAIANAEQASQVATKGKVQYIDPTKAAPQVPDGKALGEHLQGKHSPMSAHAGGPPSQQHAQDGAHHQGQEVAHQLS